jgi:hypothetical protein
MTTCVYILITNLVTFSLEEDKNIFRLTSIYMKISEWTNHEKESIF